MSPDSGSGARKIEFDAPDEAARETPGAQSPAQANGRSASTSLFSSLLGSLRFLLLFGAVQTIVFFALFRICPHDFPTGVLFYRGIAFLVAATLVTVVGALVRGLRAPAGDSSGVERNRAIYVERVVAAATLWGSLHMCFFVVVPVTIDRSVTTFLLSAMSPTEALTKDDLRHVLVDDYVDHRDAIGRRMQEQILSRNVRPEGEGFVLTAQGERFLVFSRICAVLYDLRLPEPVRAGAAKGR